MKKILIRIVNRIKSNWTNFKLHNSVPGKVLKREAKNSDAFGCYDLLNLVDAKLALVENSYKTQKVYVDQEYDLRNIKLVRALIKRYLEGDFFDYVCTDGENGIGELKYVSKVYVNPRTIDKCLKEMETLEGIKNENLNGWYHRHPDEIYRFKLNRLIWNILRDHWTDFNL